MKKTTKVNLPKVNKFRSRVLSLPLFFEEDPQLTPGLCWERKQQNLELNHF